MKMKQEKIVNNRKIKKKSKSSQLYLFFCFLMLQCRGKFILSCIDKKIICDVFGSNAAMCFKLGAVITFIVSSFSLHLPPRKKNRKKPSSKVEMNIATLVRSYLYLQWRSGIICLCRVLFLLSEKERLDPLSLARFTFQFLLNRKR